MGVRFFGPHCRPTLLLVGCVKRLGSHSTYYLAKQFGILGPTSLGTEVPDGVRSENI